MASSYRYYQLEQRGHALLVTINNPPKNFMRMGMVHELRAILDQTRDDDSIGALVFTGAPPGYFIAHADLEVVRQTDPGNPRAAEGLKFWQDSFTELTRHPKAMIAAINGQAFGGGCEFVLACDFRFMARGHWQIGLIEITLGILPGAGGTQRISRLLGRAKALEFLLEGKTVDADEAERVGLVHRAFDPDRLLPEALAYADKLARRSPKMVAALKRCVYEGLDTDLEQGLAIEREGFLGGFDQTSRRLIDAGIQAYVEGRDPDWS